jgi:hypothetical protein
MKPAGREEAASMNSYLPLMEPVIKRTHEERLKRAERARLAKSIRSNDGDAPGARARLGMMLVRTGARLLPADEREIELAQLGKRAA